MAAKTGTTAGWNQGERNGNTKLSVDDVVEIRRLSRTRHDRWIAEKFGVSHQTIYNIRTGRTWGYLKDEDQ